MDTTPKNINPREMIANLITVALISLVVALPHILAFYEAVAIPSVVLFALRLSGLAALTAWMWWRAKPADSWMRLTLTAGAAVLILHDMRMMGFLPSLTATYTRCEKLMCVDLLGILRWIVIAMLIRHTWRKKNLTTAILVAMLVGVEVGNDFPVFAHELKVISKVFLRLIKAIIAPLLFGTLVVGIAGHSNIKQVGRMGLKSLIYFEIVTTIALFIGLGAIHLTGAGTGLDQKAVAHLQKEIPQVKAQNWEEIVEHTFPENISKAIFEGAILQVVIFSILFGIGMLMISERHRKVMLDFAESLSETMFKFTNLVMYLAPFAVGAAMAVTVSDFGMAAFQQLGLLVLTLYGALAVFLLFVLLPIALYIKMPIGKFSKTISEPVTLAFATSSSESALPKAMRSMERIGVPRKIVSFVMPMGYSFNLDGTTLYLSLATIFVANAGNVHLDFGTQLVILFTLMLTSKGVAGVSRASLVILLGTASSFGLPEWPIGMILGIDAVMDMARTGVNVIGNCLASAVIAKWEGEVTEFKETEVIEETVPES